MKYSRCYNMFRWNCNLVALLSRNEKTTHLERLKKDREKERANKLIDTLQKQYMIWVVMSGKNNNIYALPETFNRKYTHQRDNNKHFNVNIYEDT